MKKSYLIVCLIIVPSLFACFSKSPSGMIQPGETTVALGSLRVSDTRVDDSQADGECDNPDCTVLYDMCAVMAPFPSAIVIAEYKDFYFVDIDRNDCSDHHRNSYYRMNLKTLGVVAGVAVPEELTTTLQGWSQNGWPPQSGQTFLISLYNINGEWFAMNDYTVTLGEDVAVEDMDPDRGFKKILDIPTSFEGLVEEAEAILANYEPCRSRSWPFWTSRQKIHDFLATPGPRCGGGDYPADPAYPEVMPNPNEKGEGGN